MRKYVIYAFILIVGLFMGWLIFAKSSDDKVDEHDHEKEMATNQLWTCSMHPQILQPEPGECPICGMELIPVEVGADGLTFDEFKLSKNAMALANIQTSVVGEGQMEAGELRLSGKIMENEEGNSVQVSFFAGRIESLNVNFTGEQIKKGQLLATIYSPELFAAQQELLTTASLKSSQPALYNAVRNKLKLWKLTESQINQIETSGKVRENFPVYATVSGTVTEKLVTEGDYVKQGQPLLKIANLETVWAMFDVYENQIDLFKIGQSIDIVANTYANENFQAKVAFIDPVLNTKTRTVKLRAELSNTEKLFKPGMFVQGSIKNVRSDAKTAIMIPSSSVLWTGERSVVYLKTNDTEPIFEMRQIKLGNKIGDNYEVLEGLSYGNVIVTNGTFTVDAAAQLKGKNSMMNKNHSQAKHTDSIPISMGNSKRLQTTTEFQNQLKKIVSTYLKMKDHLVNDDPIAVKVEAENLQKNLNEIEIKSLNENQAMQEWMAISKEIEKASNSISQTSNLKEQRIQFIIISNQLISAVKKFGVSEKVYVEFCPMADNNHGAFWISKDETIQNPYFGEAMVSCGSVIEIIQ